MHDFFLVQFNTACLFAPLVFSIKQHKFREPSQKVPDYFLAGKRKVALLDESFQTIADICFNLLIYCLGFTTVGDCTAAARVDS